VITESNVKIKEIEWTTIFHILNKLLVDFSQEDFSKVLFEDTWK
jgi:hypothetical protein